MNICNNCSKQISEQSWILHQAICNRHRKPCEYCCEYIPLYDYSGHIQDFHTYWKCECGQQILLTGKNAHLQNDCPNKLINCKYCELPLPIHKIMEHEEDCGNRTDTCEKCGKNIMYKNMTTHFCDFCPICSQVFSDINELYNHVERH